MPQPEIQLYWYWTTNPQKIRLVLEEWHLPYKCITIDLAQSEQHSNFYAQLNPRHKVPTLKVGDAILWESGAAIAYLAQNHSQIWPTSHAEQAQALSLLFMESAIFQRLAGTHFWQQVIHPRLGKKPNLDKIAAAAHQLKPIYQILTQQLGQKDFLFGSISAIDYAFAPWLPHLDLEEWPKILGWRSRLMNRPAWERAELRQDLTSLNHSK